MDPERYRPLVAKPFEFLSTGWDRFLDGLRDAAPKYRVRVYSARYLDEALPAYQRRLGQSAAAAAAVLRMDLRRVARTAYDSGMTLVDGVRGLRGLREKKPDQIIEGDAVMEMVREGYLPGIIAEVRAPRARRFARKLGQRAGALNTACHRYVSAKRVLRAARLLELYQDIEEVGEEHLDGQFVWDRKAVAASLRNKGVRFTADNYLEPLPAWGQGALLEESLFWSNREADLSNALLFHASEFVLSAFHGSMAGRHLRGLRAAKRAAEGCSERALDTYEQWREQEYGGVFARLRRADGRDVRGCPEEREQSYLALAKLLRAAEPGPFNVPALLQALADKRLDGEIPGWPFKLSGFLLTVMGTVKGLEWLQGYESAGDALACYGAAAVTAAGKWLPAAAAFIRDWPKVNVVIGGRDW